MRKPAARGCVLVLACMVAIACGASERGAGQPGEGRPYLTAAEHAAHWIASTAVVTPDGVAWPADPAVADSLVSNLYSGSPGVVLFLVDLHRVTGSEPYLVAAAQGAAELAFSLPEPETEAASGLYTGLAGQCVALQRTYEVTSEARLGVAARECFDAIVSRARQVETGVEWNPMTDIIGGTAGIGLTLMWAAERLDAPAYLDLARAAGRHLLSQAVDTGSGSKWAMAPDFERLMPNFSHGTAGIAYFLARLYAQTGEAEFLAGALAGGRYLQSVANTDREMCLVFHHEPADKELYYLSWCHGPAGTGRTFHQLYRVTDDPAWLEWTHMAARAILESGIPEQRTPGFWNNVGRCCGSAGVAEFFLDLYRVSDEPRYLEFARAVIDDLLQRSTTDAAGTRWVQAEHRVQPDNLAAQTGYMQGAAGIGTILLYLDAVERGDERPIVLPDSAF